MDKTMIDELKPGEVALPTEPALPGSVLDAFIEIKVFRREPCDEWQREYGGIGFAFTGNELWIKGKCDHKDCFPVEFPPKYSTNIEAAWKVHLHCLRSSVARKYVVALKAWYLQDFPLTGWKDYPSGFPGLEPFTAFLSWLGPYQICLASLTALESYYGDKF